MKIKLILKCLAIGLSVLLVVGVVNYTVDPALILHAGEYEKGMAEGIAQGHNIILTSNVDERIFQRELARSIEEPPDGIILGSSRIMSIPCNSLGFDNGLNLGVSGATIEDIVAIAGLYLERGSYPQTIAIGIDPWLFNANHGNTRYYELLPEYNLMTEDIQVSKHSVYQNEWLTLLEKAKSLFSFTYFQSALENIHHRVPTLEYTDDLDIEQQIKLADGSIIYGRQMRGQTPAEVIQSVNNSLKSGTLYYSTDYRAISDEITNIYEHFIDHILALDIEIILILSPLHPLAYDYCLAREEYQMYMEAEQYVRQYASSRGIIIIGSYNPNQCNATEMDFYDWMHPRRTYMQALCEGKKNPL